MTTEQCGQDQLPIGLFDSGVGGLTVLDAMRRLMPGEDYLFVPKIREAIADGKTEFEAYVVKDGALKPFTLRMGELTPDEKDIILKGCLINYYRG